MLNNRLLTIAKHVPIDAKVVDVGCDHAYLSIHLCQQKLVQTVIASDIVSGPIEAARSNIQSAGLIDNIKIVQADGLMGVIAGEVDCVIVAGMGANTIIDILNTGMSVVEQCQHLILQPMVGTDKLRLWLADQGWQCTEEDLCLDAGRLYEIIVAQPCQKPYTINKLQALLGKLAGHKLFAEHVQALVDKYQHLLNNLQKAEQRDEKLLNKVAEFENLLLQLREVKNECLGNQYNTK